MVVFIASLITFSIYLNKGNTDMTLDMSDPSLPVAYIEIGGRSVNEMHGYLDRMDASTIRDSITPVGEDRMVQFVIDKYDEGISSLRLEIRSNDGNRLIEDTKIINYSDYQDNLKAAVQLKDLIEENKEYNLVLIVTLSDGREVYYYTRVVMFDDSDVSNKIDFVLDFSNKTFSKDNNREFATYMEPNSDGDNTNLGRVDIHSSINQLTWGDIKPRRLTEPIVTIEEIGDTQGSFELKYLVTSTDSNHVTHNYKVREYYRIRVTGMRTYLLSYSRTMDEIFVMEKEALNENSIDFGIKSEEVEFAESEDGSILTFEDDGRLYSINLNENKLIRLFALYENAGDDRRNIDSVCNTQVLSIEENGNISFISYGYFPRGIHEGMVGVVLYYYNSVLNTVEEQAFVPYDGSESVLRCDIEKLNHLSGNGDLFIFMDGIVYKVSPTLGTIESITNHINEDTFYVSDSGRLICWQEKSEDDDTVDLNVMNLARGNTQTISKMSNQYIKPLGFMNEDLIYGICDRNDIIRDRLGDTIYLLNTVYIVDEKQEVLKQYSSDGLYVTDGSINDNQITLNRVSYDRETGTITPREDDQITNNREQNQGKNKIESVNLEDYQKTARLSMYKSIDGKTLKLLTPREVIFEGGRTFAIKSVEKEDRFIVYGDGEIVGIYDTPASAVNYAYDIRGTVTDNIGNELYKRGETVARNQIMAISEQSVTDTKDSLAVCLDTMLKLNGISRNSEMMLSKGETVYEILSKNLKNAYILDLSGCTMDMMLYYVNQDIPVLAYMRDDTAMLIIGFNEQNIVLFDPTEGTIYKMGKNDARTMFEENGNHFMTYIFKDEG